MRDKKKLQGMGVKGLQKQAKLRGIKYWGKLAKKELLRRVCNIKTRRRYTRTITVDDEACFSSSCGDVTGSEEDSLPRVRKMQGRRVTFATDVDEDDDNSESTEQRTKRRRVVVSDDDDTTDDE